MTRLMLKAVAAYPCSLPSSDEVEAARRQLEGFAVFEVKGKALAARRPSSKELDDLAYFMASVRDAGGEVGRSTEEGDGAWYRPGPKNLTREQLLEQIEAAKLDGQLETVAELARAYLQTLGYPGELQTETAHEYTWGGARYSYVMRDLAETLESLGELDEAAHLYRRANPGGGACATSASSNWEAQIRGVIRCEERRRRCSAAIPERLLDLRSPPLGAYGVDRLKEAGFDLAALYRGALVTINRDADQAELASALAKAPGSIRVQASKRLAERGPEAWERRVFALEGLADVAGREALPALISAIKLGTRAVRLRAIDALGKIAAVPPFDPCSPELHGGYGYGSSQWERHITDLGRSCDTVLSAEESAALTTKLLPFTRDADPEIREATARALGKIASPAAVPPLEKLLNDPYQIEGSRTCDSGPDGKLINCRVPFPVKEAAKEALDHIEEIRSSRQKSPPQNI